MNINIVVIGGNLTADPDTKFLPSGTAATEFTIAVNETWKNGDGVKQEKAHFLRCFTFGKTGENIAKYFKKGNRIIVTGSLSQEAWEDKETGKKREKTRVKVDSFEFVDSNASTAKQGDPRPAAKPARDPDLDAAESDDIPF